MLTFTRTKTIAKAILQLAGKLSKKLFVIQSVVDLKWQTKVYAVYLASYHYQKKPFYDDRTSMCFVFSIKSCSNFDY